MTNPERLWRNLFLTLAGAVIVLLTALLWGPPSPAVGQDETDDGTQYVGAQRLAQIQGMKDANQRLDKIIDILQSGKIKVVVANLPEAMKAESDEKANK